MNLFKPYLFGGVALLIVGLFFYSSVTRAKLDTATLLLETTTEANRGLQNRVIELEKLAARKEGAAAAYAAVEGKLDKWLPKAKAIVEGYKSRETEDEKCLDRTPPAELLRLLRQNDLQR